MSLTARFSSWFKSCQVLFDRDKWFWDPSEDSVSLPRQRPGDNIAGDYVKYLHMGRKGNIRLDWLPAFTFISEYAGEIVDDTDGKAMLQTGKDTHLLVLSSKFNAIDGSVHGQVTEDYYCRHHKMGAFANTSTETARRNCHYVTLEIPARFAYAQSYEETTKSYPSTNYEKRIFLVTTKFVSAGTEFLTDYQRGYYERHDIVWSKSIVFNGKIKQISTHENFRVYTWKMFHVNIKHPIKHDTFYHVAW